MTPYNQLPRQHRKIIDAFRANNNELNSLRFRFLAIQLPVRIKELREEYLWPISKPTKLNKDRSVDYILSEASNRTTRPQYQPQMMKQPWEEELVRIEKNGKVFWEPVSKVGTRQLELI